MKPKKLSFSLFILLSALQIQAQLPIKGTLKSKEGTPVEYANIQLLEKKDSTFVIGTISDKRGKFEMTTPKGGNFLLKISAVSYETCFRNIKEGERDLGNILLKEDTLLLDEVTVTANRIINKIDRQVAFPGKLETESSNNGMELLAKMAFPHLKVDEQNRAVSLIDQGSVLLRINGIPATANDVYALSSKEIIRIEYHDNPGVRVQEKAIVDIIVRRRESGGYASLDARNTPYMFHGDDMATIKLNHRHSEWSAWYNLSFRDYSDRWEESTITYKTPDETFQQEKSGIPSPFNYQDHNVQLAYNYTLPDKRTFNSQIKGNFFRNHFDMRNQNTYSNRTDADFGTEEEERSPGQTAVADLYYKESFAGKQSLYANVVGGYSHSTYDRHYRETNLDSGSATEYTSDVDGKKYYLITEINHEKTWEKGMLYSGIKYSTGHTENSYGGTINQKTSMKNSEAYLYTQFQGKHNKLAYVLGLGVSYSRFSESEEGFKFWTFRPNVSLSYFPTASIQLRYSFEISPHIPSLSQLSAVEQVVDMYQITRGNPGLSPFRAYTNNLSASWQKNRWQCNAGVTYNWLGNAIMTDITWDDNWKKFVFTDNNQQHWTQAGIYAAISYQAIPNMLHLNCMGMIQWTDSKGNSYRHKHTSYYGRIGASFYHKGWSAGIYFGSPYQTLWGHSLNYGEWPTLTLNAGYKYKRLYAGISCHGLFTDRASYRFRILDDHYSMDMHSYIGESSPLVNVHLKWDIAWGKKSQAATKAINNSDNDNGILKAGN